LPALAGVAHACRRAEWKTGAYRYESVVAEAMRFVRASPRVRA
jgi:hypothetical protein